VFGSCGVSRGCHYWAIKLDAFATEEDIIIGICRKDVEKINYSATASEISTFYGFSPSSGIAISFNRRENVWDPCCIGNEVGLFLD